MPDINPSREWDPASGEPFIWIDPTGGVWEIVDFRFNELGDRRIVVPLEHHSSEGRAFVPALAPGAPLIYVFRGIAYRTLDETALANQFRYASPLRASADWSFDVPGE